MSSVAFVLFLALVLLILITFSVHEIGSFFINLVTVY